MDIIKAAIGPVLLASLIGGLGTFFLGWTALGLIEMRGQADGSTLTGYAIALMFFWTPLGAALGALFGTVWTLRQRLR